MWRSPPNNAALGWLSQRQALSLTCMTLVAPPELQERPQRASFLPVLFHFRTRVFIPSTLCAPELCISIQSPRPSPLKSRNEVRHLDLSCSVYRMRASLAVGVIATLFAASTIGTELANGLKIETTRPGPVCSRKASNGDTLHVNYRGTLQTDGSGAES